MEMEGLDALLFHFFHLLIENGLTMMSFIMLLFILTFTQNDGMAQRLPTSIMEYISSHIDFHLICIYKMKKIALWLTFIKPLVDDHDSDVHVFVSQRQKVPSLFNIINSISLFILKCYVYNLN